MNELLGSISTILAVSGCLLNNRGKRICFIVWIISNFISGWLHYDLNLYSLVIRDIIFTALSIEGFIIWSSKKGGNIIED